MEVIVKQNDTLWSFSQLFNIPLPLIELSNRNVAPNELNIGDRIKIPGYQSIKYDIKPDDSLWKIALQFNIPLRYLYAVNSYLDANNLRIGQIINIPHRVTDFVVNDIDQYDFNKMQADIRELLDVYPFILTNNIGQSVMGKEIIELQLGNGERQVHLNGSFHANEWITTPILMRFINHFCLSLTNNQSIRGLAMLPLFLQATLSIVPMVNPDGVDLVINGSNAAGQYKDDVLTINNRSENFSNWKANIRGVDLNNQYPAKWDIESERKPSTPQPRDFPGYQPLTEPEAIAIANLTRSKDFAWVNAFHTQGEVIYWGYDGLEPPVAEPIVEEYARVSGYRPVQFVDSYAGYKDWFIQEFRRPGYTVEFGSGINPLPIGQFGEIYEEFLGIMLANLYLQ
ncbi:M14 family metallopeptidase [Ornithinibacillus halophilus]|uniref:Gamma-D-glutamyl-(L)-meso-diaminopimelate peptidase I Metallo peptidase. MEROPS family M14C n=1 Tax=Ornithinibacillus halophilus TaxID=930117 RepID=A0A1M5CKY2_9BACI|nr:M14 family metallopeptidase [Ornithinibacillus halophilus]SHF55082.1 gamma-D-glutamyl-{L}-meso-diaminopimelate peptidase I Metallo peptidase. MEROPS family M14C [Ornithinibacillus halophilus]